MQLYRLLPRSNCGRCGCITCLAFAAELREGKKELSGCPVLAEEASAQNRSGLLALLGLPAG
jgi:CO dehydrogenase/acetyl-CoA synthase gamma subunit (corrinoid Fe-S protein)